MGVGKSPCCRPRFTGVVLPVTSSRHDGFRPEVRTEPLPAPGTVTHGHTCVRAWLPAGASGTRDGPPCPHVQVAAGGPGRHTGQAVLPTGWPGQWLRPRHVVQQVHLAWGPLRGDSGVTPPPSRKSGTSCGRRDGPPRSAGALAPWEGPFRRPSPHGGLRWRKGGTQRGKDKTRVLKGLKL